MNDERQRQQSVDRYLRKELDSEQEAEFETRLMEDAKLQAELEAALAIRLGLDESAGAKSRQPTAEAQSGSSVTVLHNANSEAESTVEPGRSGAPWTGYALAASLLIAIASTGMVWRTSTENATLRERVEALQTLRGIQTVRVDIMRGGCEGTPGTIVQLPSGTGTVVLDIELSPAFRNLPGIAYRLTGSGGEPRFIGQASPAADGRLRLAIAGESLSADVMRLGLQGTEGDPSECRLIEFRSP